VFGVGQETRALEDAEVLVHAGERHAERPGELGDGGFPGGEPCEDRAARGVGERGEDRA